MKTIILSSKDVVRIVKRVGLDRMMDEAIRMLVQSCKNFDPNDYQIPVREGFNYDHPVTGLLEWMPVMQVGERITFKMVGYHPLNPEVRRLPTVLSSAMVLDTSTGHMMGLIDATFPTALRTGAASAVASRILAADDSKVLGLVGAGSQSVTQFHAISRLFELERVLVFDIDADISKSLKQRIAILGVDSDMVQHTSLAEVVCNADILCTATSIGVGKGPVLGDLGLKPSLHVNAVGSDFPGKTELPLSLLERSLVCPDFVQQALKEGESQQLSIDQLGPDLVTLIKAADDYRYYKSMPTVFDSTGWALEDQVVIEMLFRYAEDMGYGTPVQLECISADPYNPYGFIADADNNRERQEVTTRPNVVTR